MLFDFMLKVINKILLIADVSFAELFSVVNNDISILNQKITGGGRKRLPKFKFSAKFPIGLHVTLQIQIKKFENDCYIM